MEIFLYEPIVQGSAKKFVDEIQQFKNKPVTVRINSGGGSVFEGLSIYNAIKTHGQVTIQIDGLAASIASLIAMAGSRVEMAGNSLIMIHNPWSATEGDSNELKKQADLLDKCKTTMLEAYVKKTGLKHSEISQIMDSESWFTAEEAFELGLIDVIYEPLQAAASFHGIERFNLPERIKSMTQTKNVIGSDVEAKLKELTSIKAEQKRQGDIKARFYLFKKKASPQLRDVMDGCIDDPAVTVEQAVERVNNQLGLESIGADCGAHGANVVKVDPVTGMIQTGTSGPHASFGSNQDHNFLQAATDALLIRNGVRLNNPHPASRDLRNMGIPEIARNFLRLSNDLNASGYSNRDAVVKAMHSTSDFPLLLANTGGKSLQEGYQFAPITCREWTSEREVPDFKEQTLTKLSEAPDMLEVAEGGEYKHGTFGESADKFKIKKWGRIFSITREALVNDDLSAFTRLPFAFGQRAAALESDEVYSLLTSGSNLTDGSPLFDSSRGNLASTGSILSVSSLGEARAAMRNQKGVDGKTIIDIQPRFLIVPAELETNAEQLLSSLVDSSKNNDTANPAWIRSLSLVADPRMSGTSWYLASDANQAEGIIRAFLAGEDRPYIEEKAGFEVDDFTIKARLEFAAAIVDPKSLYKNPGA